MLICIYRWASLLNSRTDLRDIGSTFQSAKYGLHLLRGTLAWHNLHFWKQWRRRKNCILTAKFDWASMIVWPSYQYSLSPSVTQVYWAVPSSILWIETVLIPYFDIPTQGDKCEVLYPWHRYQCVWWPCVHICTWTVLAGYRECCVRCTRVSSVFTECVFLSTQRFLNSIGYRSVFPYLPELELTAEQYAHNSTRILSIFRIVFNSDVRWDVSVTSGQFYLGNPESNISRLVHTI